MIVIVIDVKISQGMNHGSHPLHWKLIFAEKFDVKVKQKQN